jgi:hypothetical protein
MMHEIQTPDDAANDYLNSLPSERRRELQNVVLVSSTSESNRWYEDVITRYDLRNPESHLLKDIRGRMGDEQGFMSFMFSGYRSEEPILEAEYLLRLVQRKLIGEVNL